MGRRHRAHLHVSVLRRGHCGQEGPWGSLPPYPPRFSSLQHVGSGSSSEVYWWHFVRRRTPQLTHIFPDNSRHNRVSFMGLGAGWLWSLGCGWGCRSPGQGQPLLVPSRPPLFIYSLFRQQSISALQPFIYLTPPAMLKVA